MRLSAYIIVLFLAASLAGAQTTIYTGPNGAHNKDYWNNASYWSSGIPSGTTNAFIPVGVTASANANSTTPTYTGDLTISNNATVLCGNDLASYNIIGTPGITTIYFCEGAYLNFRSGGAPSVPAIVLLGNGQLSMSQSTQGPSDPTFGQGISGDFAFMIQGKGGCDAHLTVANTFKELITDPQYGSDFNIHADAAGSLGCDVTIKANASDVVCANLIINFADAMSDTANLSLNGASSTTRITMNADDTIGSLYLDGVRQASGTYGASGSGADYEVSWLAGTGILTVPPLPALYWDLNGASAGAGGAAPGGTWDGATANWSTSPAGTTATAVWTPGSIASFAAGADASGTYTVSVSGMRNISGVNFEEGTVTLSGGALQMTSDSYFDVASGGTATISGIITNDATPWQAVKSGDGTLILSGVNTYTGPTRIEGGVLAAASLTDAGTPCNLGNYASSGAGGIVFAGGTLRYTGGTASINRGFTLQGAGALDLNTPSAALTMDNVQCSVASGDLTVSGTSASSLSVGQITLVEGVGVRLNPTSAALSVASVYNSAPYPYPTVTMTLDGSSDNCVIEGSISKVSGGINIVKQGAGTWTLNGNPNANGTLAVNDGRLVINGSFNANGTVNVNSGGTLAGTGSLADPLNVASGGTVAPGNDTGTFTVPSATIAGTLKPTLDSTQSTNVSTLSVSGALDITGATLEINKVAANSEPLVIATYGTLTGTFASGTSGIEIDYAYSGGKAIAVTVPASGLVLIVK